MHQACFAGEDVPATGVGCVLKLMLEKMGFPAEVPGVEELPIKTRYTCASG